MYQVVECIRGIQSIFEVERVSEKAKVSDVDPTVGIEIGISTSSKHETVDRRAYRTHLLVHTHRAHPWAHSIGYSDSEADTLDCWPVVQATGCRSSTWSAVTETIGLFSIQARRDTEDDTETRTIELTRVRSVRSGR